MFRLFWTKPKEATYKNAKNGLKLKKAIRGLKSEPSARNIITFAMALKAIVDQGEWVPVPGTQDGENVSIKIIESNGKYFAAMLSDYGEVKKMDHGDVAVTDINKLIELVFHNETLNGIIIDPFTTSLCLEKQFLLKCLLHAQYPSQENSGYPQRDWGVCIPKYTRNDLMTEGEIQNFAMQSVLEHESSLQEYTLVSACDYPGAMPSIIMEKGHDYLFILVKGYIAQSQPVISDEEKLQLSMLGAKYNARCFYAPVGFIPADVQRFNAKLALHGDGFYCIYKGLEAL